MRTLIRSILFSAFSLAAGAAPPPALFAEQDLAHAKRAMAIALESDFAFDLVAELTSQIGPRPGGSANDAKAVAWAQKKLTAFGFDSVWVQPVKIEAWARDRAFAEIVAPYRQHLAVAALGNSVSTPPGGIVGELAYFKSLADLKADTSGRAKGRVVFIDSEFKASRDGAGYALAVPARTQGASEAARLGARAVLIRSIGTDRDRLPHTGSVNYAQGVKRIPAAAVSVPDADLIARLAASGVTPRVSLVMTNTSARNRTTHNVFAEIRGTERPEEVVAIGAHLDSWDLGTGALDDGAGVAIVVAAAKILKDMGVKPRRTIRLILFGNEENGLDGARAYLDKNGHQRHQLVAEADAGADAIYQMNTRVAEGTLPWMRAIGEVIAPLGIAAGHNNASPGADFSPLLRKVNPPVIGMAQDMTRYFDYHHTANDTLDKIDPQQLRQNVAAWAAMAWLAAQAEAGFAGAAQAGTPR
jgi:Zn-dependent M28 family amino/carboxypeptidase